MKTCIFPFILTTAALSGQDVFTIEWSNFSGGGQSPGGTGEYTVEGSIGQLSTDASTAGPPGEFGLSSGYWTFTLNEPLELGLTMQLNGGNVSLFWDDPGIVVRLESSTDLQLWAPVNPQPPHPQFIEAAGQRRFYRLMPGQ